MKRSIWLGLAGGLMTASTAIATAAELYVDAANASGTELGTQQSPFRTVQAAINASATGDEVRVAAGTYVENLRIDGKGILLKGGFSSSWVRDVAANTTTLSGAGGNAVINILAADATIDGFRITGGTGSTEEAPYGYHGGAIYSRDGSVTISNNTIESNDIRKSDSPSDYNRGGGLYVFNAPNATIVNNVVRGNFAGRGGGMFVVAQAALIQGNIVENNVGNGDHGGGLFIAVVDAKITENVIRGNEIGRDLSYGWGGGLIFEGAGNSAEISFNTVYGNFAAGYGAGEFIDEGAYANIHHELIYRNSSKLGCEAVSAISVDGGDNIGSKATISFCTIAGNVCENAVRGNGLQVEGKSDVSVINCIFWNNGGDDFSVDGASKLSVSYSCSEEAIAGTGNISADPRFANEAADDYHLASGSPCIDAADPSSPFSNEPADNGGRADMGRFGNTSGSIAAQPNTGTVNTGDGGSSGGSQSADEDAAAAGNDAVSSAGLCPTASAMLLSISLIGVGRTRRGRSANSCWT